ncbi:hypothetical protein IV203_034902 [Nitzschia inconspicua]|uniref:Uncharacterized protein n=1 Tax=Nitzschia inconspicua TaxID=303405 RepID=A0A9K3PWM1_9STRA|nr:hypothetical protein IV203_034902 [Nitzschia inconspicua]
MRRDLVRKETPDDCWRKGLFLSPPRKTQRLTKISPPQLQVRFAPDCALTQVHTDYSRLLYEEEQASFWYTKQEYALMKRSSSFTIRLMTELQQRGASPSKYLEQEDEEMCTRGLEAKTRSGARRRRQNIVTAIDAVLMEQERQRQVGSINDIYNLAHIYKDATASCSMDAWLAAQKDAKAVEDDFVKLLSSTIPVSQLPSHTPLMV